MFAAIISAPPPARITLIRPPSSRLGPITPDERRKIIAESPVAGQYDQVVDRESAFEILQKKAKEAQDAEDQAQQQKSGGSRWTIPGFDDVLGTGGRRGSNRQTVAEAAIKSVVRSVGSSVGRAIVRGILGSLARGR